jgi:peptidoglycan/LPS O-acetylase OafA/YrhL
MVAGGQYFSNIPYSLYPKSNFWIDSPALIVIRLGLILVALSAAYLWTEFGAGAGWSWMQTLGKTSLMVYWVHVVLVYGSLLGAWKRALSVPEVTAVTAAVTLLMLALAVARLRWKIVWPRRAPAG